MYRIFGRFLHVALEPLIRFFVNKTSRSRIIIRNGKEILVMKNWLGDGDWVLPGGGIHEKEDPLAGALRELYEETGIRMANNQLQLALDEVIDYGNGFAFRTVILEGSLQHKPKLKRLKKEITDLEWVSIDELLHTPKTGLLLKKVGYPEKL